MNDMKKIYIMMMLVLTGTMALAQTSVWHGGRAVWTRGSGTENDPFLIESADNLAYLAYVVNKYYDTEGLYFRLTTDIDLNGSEDLQWIPIGVGDKRFNFSEDGCERGWPSYGNFYDGAYPIFRGHFDGGEHSISNIYINDENRSYLGLFGNVRGGNEEKTAVIENVFVISGYIRGNGSCGGIVGTTADSVLVSRCWSGVVLECGGGMRNGVGGIVGQNQNPSRTLHIQNCYNIGSVSAYVAGGILGGGGAEIEECYNKGDITGTFAGGVFGGDSQARIIINNCYNTGNVDADGVVPGSYPAGPAAGGIAGAAFMGNQTVIMTNCYNVGNVSSTKNIGCIMAYARDGVFENNYYINTCDAGGEGTPQTEDYMRTQAFVDCLNGGNREPIWAMDVNHTNDGFPILTSIDLTVPEITDASFNVYPNPAQGRFTVEGTGRMTVSNLLGQVVLVKEINGQTTVALPRGMYFVKLGNETQKIVVE